MSCVAARICSSVTQCVVLNLARSSYQLDSSPTRHPGRSERVSAAAQEPASIDASIVSTPPRCSRQAMHQWRCFPMPELPILLAVVIEWRGPGTRLHLSSSPSNLNVASSQRHRQRQLLRHVVQVPCPTCMCAHMSDTTSSHTGATQSPAFCEYRYRLTCSETRFTGPPAPDAGGICAPMNGPV